MEVGWQIAIRQDIRENISAIALDPTNEDLSATRSKRGILGRAESRRIFIFCGNNTRERHSTFFTNLLQ